ncbi:glycoprotein-N-acetylgalactosamine 3-beta-galactosyltransferase 1-like [Lytechinus pictus]|uniref:glycoprotein-N-acetylgalactosamine 3-beta-galactosyltransferase 1-like n=1 Tax=Lytechinus pictus TaxID=7653 RepID=UPI0030BA174D
MGSSRFRFITFILVFISGAISMWCALTVITQHMLIYQRHHQSRTETGISREILAGVTQQGRLNKTRLLCWIMTSPMTLETKASTIARTWSKKCHHTLYMSSRNSTNFPGTVIGLEVADGRPALWNKTRKSLEYIYKHHFNDADWFLKADDDTYVVVENLMAFLSNRDPAEPVYYGFDFNTTLPYLKSKSKKIDYPSGGAGYVISREALKRFVEVGLKNRTGCCPGGYSDWPEDMCLGLCMESVGVRSEDHRDQFGRFRFLPIALKYFLDDGSAPLEWLHGQSTYGITRGKYCCSESLISIHYVKPGDMLVYDFLLNNVTIGVLDE